MGIPEISAAIFMGNIMTAAFLASLWQFWKHDANAPWLAYAGTLFPLAMAILAMLATGETPPFLDALASR